jgi:hypothetical protein
MRNSFPSHQTVKLSRGKHSSPRDGVCVMELASMLAGERFSDRPYCVSPVIGAFLRAYNDYVDDRLRQDLYRVASAVVGTRATPEIERLRLQRVIEWGKAMRRARRWSWLTQATDRLRIRDRDLSPDEAGGFAVRAIGRKSERAHAQVVSLVDDLIAYGQAGVGGTALAGKTGLVRARPLEML